MLLWHHQKCLIKLQKKTWPDCKGTNFSSHKNYSDIAGNLCIVFFMIFTCYPFIFLCFMQFHWQRFFLSLLVVFAIHIGNPGIHECRHFLQRPNLNWKLTFNIFSWYQKAFGNFLGWKNQWALIFSSLETVVVMCNILGYLWQTNAIWISVFLFMPNCQIII